MRTPPAAGSPLPRLSEAQRLLPLLRSHLVAAAARRPLATTFDVVPVVEDGVFGYELVPRRRAHSYLIIGRNAEGRPVLRKTSYGMGHAAPLRLAAAGGVPVPPSGHATRTRVESHDSGFGDWRTAAEAAWRQLLVDFPDRPRRRPVQCADRCGLESALADAAAHLAPWDPRIEFFGLPDAQPLGFALSGPGGESGELGFARPNVWTLRWNAGRNTVRESWPVAIHDDEADGCDAPDLRYTDRRAHRRGGVDCERVPDRRAGTDRRQGDPRRAMDRTSRT